MKSPLIASCVILFVSPVYAQYVPYPQAESTMPQQENSYQPQPYERSYNPPAYGDGGYNVGAQGYDGITGQVDTTYIPTGTDPNPPPNVYR